VNELLTHELREALRERFDDVTATPALYDRIQRRIARRRRVRTVAGALATTAAVLVAIVAAPRLLTGDELRIDDRPGDLGDRPDAASATDPTHGVFTTQGGGLVGVDLASGTRTELLPDPDPGHAATVIDLTVAAGSSIDDFTAIAFDDGAGPIGLITYVRRDGGEVRTSFTPNDGRLPGHSNRGWRTISPDGRWLAYSAYLDEDRSGVGLVPIDATTGELDTDEQRFLPGVGAPAGWTGPVTEPGDRSVMVHHSDGEGRFTATILERTADEFDVIETVHLDVDHVDDPDGTGMRRLVFGSLLPGQLDDARFDVVIEHPEVESSELVPRDHAVVRYRGPDGRAAVRFELSERTGNPDLAVRARTALLTLDSGSASDDPDTDGAAWLIRAEVDGDEITLEPHGPLIRGVVSGALLDAPRDDQPPTDPDALPPLTWDAPADYRYTLRSACGNRSDLGRHVIVVEDGEVTSTEAPRRGGGAPTRLGFVAEYDGDAPTLLELYDEARAATEAGAYLVEFTTDPATGRPTRLDIDRDVGATDDEACFIVEDYAPTVR
jgi:hypothetical protein